MPTAIAQVQSEIHKLCFKAADYEGCVRANTQGGAHRVVIQEGASLNEGNACPVGFAYSGGGVTALRLYVPTSIFLIMPC
jgi:hypothetical protein